MNKEELENFKGKGPCVCEATDCWYCSAIGDFKFQWAVAKSERDILANQLERAIEIGGALTTHTYRTEEAFEWNQLFDRLVSEVRGKPKQIE